MFVQVPVADPALHRAQVSYVQIACVGDGYFNTDLKNVIFLGSPSAQAEPVIPRMARTFTAALIDDALGEPADFVTPGDPFGS